MPKSIGLNPNELKLLNALHRYYGCRVSWDATDVDFGQRVNFAIQQDKFGKGPAVITIDEKDIYDIICTDDEFEMLRHFRCIAECVDCGKFREDLLSCMCMNWSFMVNGQRHRIGFCSRCSPRRTVFSGEETAIELAKNSGLLSKNAILFLGYSQLSVDPSFELASIKWKEFKCKKCGSVMAWNDSTGDPECSSLSCQRMTERAKLLLVDMSRPYVRNMIEPLRKKKNEPFG